MRLSCLVLLAFSLCLHAEKKQVFPPGAVPAGPYSPGVLANDFLYVAGQGARDSNLKYAATPEGNVRQCLNNVKAIVEAAGLTMEHVVYSQVFLHPTVTYDLFNAVWKEYFPKNPPARATIGTHRMPTETPVQVNAVVVRDLKEKKPLQISWYPKNMPIAPAIEAKGRVFISGFLGRELDGTIPEDPEKQMKLAMGRITDVLKVAGLDWRHMVMTYPWHTAKMPRRALDKVYAGYVEHGNTPARATIQVPYLPMDANVELSGIAVKDLAQRKAVRPKNMPPSPTASPCVMAYDTLYCSSKAGFIPGPNGGIYTETVEDQVRMAMRNLLDGLEEVGMDFSNVVATTVHLDSIDDFAKMNATYGKYFQGGVPPARSSLGPLAPVERKRSESGQFPKLAEILVIAVK
ncbi:MAG: RidA family protein [Bryobacterales bacterium]|nr:RidA family protein [Bryobacterales bacterium]